MKNINGIDLKSKVLQLHELAKNLNLAVAGVVTEEGKNNSFSCFYVNELESSNSEELTNVFLMIKSKGDLNRFLIEKAKKDKATIDSYLLNQTNSQILTTKH